MNPNTKRIALALAILVVPGSSIAVGSYLLFKGIKAILDKDSNKETKDEKTGKSNPNVYAPFE